ncbi:MAG: hypothetical protein H7249_20005 [Chitinophagaceae bacterium]|nr:hypothetical protein [Oligoflexus sp.]
MKFRLLGLMFLGTFACKTSEAVSEQKMNSSAQSSATAVMKGPVEPGASPKVESESLLKWRVGRFTIGADSNEKMDKEGSIACDITASAVKKHLGNDKLVALQKSIATLYPIRANRSVSPIFRGLKESRELVASLNGEEFLIEKMFQSRDAISPLTVATPSRSIPTSSPETESLELLMTVATNPLLCPKLPI